MIRVWRPAVEALALLCEVALLVVLAVAGLGIGTGRGLHVTLAVLLPVLAVLVWSRWMAPRSPARLADPARLAAQVVLFVAAGALAVAAGHPVVGVGYAVVACAVFGAARRTGGVTGGGPTGPAAA